MPLTCFFNRPQLSLGQMCPRFLAFCHRRHRGTPEPFPEPALEESDSEGSEAASTAASTLARLPGRVDREVLWVVPSQGGAYFGHEGLQPPPDGAVRWYCIWDIPGIGRWRIAGLHWGRGTIAYGAILRLHNNEFRRIRFRRCFSREEAVETFNAEAAAFDLTEVHSRRIFGWTFCDDLESRE